MREQERRLARARLDREMQAFRKAGMEKNSTSGLLRAVRQALGIEIAEIAKTAGVDRSVVYDLEARELSAAITLRSLARQAEAMGCKVVYGIVPLEGKTLERLAEERWWARELEKQGTRG
jgi:predicted DNA-binding mobile mystery protein A